jgi:dephospho-CoA kinase
MTIKKLKIAVTGGIGSGKSILTDHFETKGFPIIRSDLIAKELMNSDIQIQKRIKKTFGEASFIDGKLNKRFLSEIIFSNEEKLLKINSIIHPVTTKRADDLAQKYFEKHDLVFVESALVYEVKIDKKFDYIILVYASEELRIQRTIAREGVGETEVRKRMQFQIPDEEKLERVDFVIENNSNIEEFKNRADFILSLLIQFSKI